MTYNNKDIEHKDLDKDNSSANEHEIIFELSKKYELCSSYENKQRLLSSVYGWYMQKRSYLDYDISRKTEE